MAALTDGMNHVTVGFISECLSWAIIVICAGLKLPQITALLGAKSARGVSLNSVLLEFWCYTINLAYNVNRGYSLSTYFEYVLLEIQDVAILLLLFYYLNTPIAEISAYSTVYFATGVLVAGGFLPEPVIVLLFNLLLPVNVASRFIQARKIVVSQDAGSVSPLTWFLSAATGVGRIFTTYVGSGDVSIMLNMAVGAMCSTSLLIVVLMYRKSAGSVHAKSK